jgi:hypothetical protein
VSAAQHVPSKIAAKESFHQKEWADDDGDDVAAL